MNSYPFLDNKLHPISDIELGDLVPRLRKNRILDISASPLIPATELREKLDVLLMAGELDGGLPILRNKVLVGLIPVPELEFALDKLEDEDETLCLMSPSASANLTSADDDDDDTTPTDFTQYIDPVSFSIDIGYYFLHLFC